LPDEYPSVDALAVLRKGPELFLDIAAGKEDDAERNAEKSRAEPTG
jgi:hypothetical protein